jgi:hypothetical protein
MKFTPNALATGDKTGATCPYSDNYSSIVFKIQVLTVPSCEPTMNEPPEIWNNVCKEKVTDCQGTDLFPESAVPDCL